MSDSFTMPSQLLPFLTPKHCSGSFELGTQEFEVEISTPSLQDSVTSAWADWGPMYTCEPEINHPIELRYRCKQTQQEARYLISPAEVELNTPRDAKTRDQVPFKLEFHDTARVLKFSLSLDPDGEVARLEVSQVLPNAKAHALIFREAQLATSRNTPAYVAPSQSFREARATH